MCQPLSKATPHTIPKTRYICVCLNSRKGVQKNKAKCFGAKIKNKWEGQLTLCYKCNVMPLCSTVFNISRLIKKRPIRLLWTTTSFDSWLGRWLRWTRHSVLAYTISTIGNGGWNNNCVLINCNECNTEKEYQTRCQQYKQWYHCREWQSSIILFCLLCGYTCLKNM